MGTSCINVGLKRRLREKWETEDPIPDTFQRVAGRHEQPKPGANGTDKHIDLTTNVTYSADIIKKWLHCYTGVYPNASDNLPDRSESVLHVP
jgi:hypothetical protein